MFHTCLALLSSPATTPSVHAHLSLHTAVSKSLFPPLAPPSQVSTSIPFLSDSAPAPPISSPRRSSGPFHSHVEGVDRAHVPGKLGCVRAGLGTQRACVTVFCPRDRGGVEGGPGARAGAPGGAELRETARGALTPALLSGTGRGKDSRLRGSRRCQCGWARSGAGVGQLELRS